MSEATPRSPWFVYLLRCADGTLYCGVTTDVSRRLGEHNAGTGARYTRGRGPITLEACAPFPDRATACRVEYAIKQRPATDKVASLEQMHHALGCGLSAPSGISE
ncbi:putative endonuclease [Desulfobaculum xiamenense]|uniref:Putative endonuclease n=1 Tax=Desulfobaculum xiamenense TaxID=995050 RepID=A0A846QSH1_9BACT|nr:GIY-YIG nuclease family protein [Desulfobaculum xiamenense]NJB69313.1 putative endonuclease [Desulfobaculum xiamenense]